MNSRSIIVIASGILYGMMTTAFFGNNLFPKSADECIVDGLALIIVSIGIAIGNSKRE